MQISINICKYAYLNALLTASTLLQCQQKRDASIEVDLPHQWWLIRLDRHRRLATHRDRTRIWLTADLCV